MITRLSAITVAVFTSLISVSLAQVSREDAANAFVSASAEICIPAVEASTLVRDLDISDDLGLTPFSVSQDDTSPSETFTLLDMGGIVRITNDDATYCSVSAYGPAVSRTFKDLAKQLTSPALGYVEDKDGVPQREGVIMRGFVKTLEDGRKYTVFLSGNEPGAPGTASRFSTLTASVRLREAEPEQ